MNDAALAICYACYVRYNLINRSCRGCMYEGASCEHVKKIYEVDKPCEYIHLRQNENI